MEDFLNKGRLKTLLIGLIIGVAYAFFATWLITIGKENVSISFTFVLPLILGAIPVLFSTKEQLKSYLIYLVMPWVIVFTFFSISFLRGMEGMICLVIIIGPFLLLGSLGAFIIRLIVLRNSKNKTPLYSSLLLPFIFLMFETTFQAEDQFHEVITQMEMNVDQATAWEQIKEVKNIQSEEIPNKFIYSVMQVPLPLNGELNYEGEGATRAITWEKEIHFQEEITDWNEGESFSYEVNVNPSSIPPTSLDEHVMIGGKYFDVVNGGYKLTSLGEDKTLVELRCTYRITTTFNFYSKWWADFLVDELNDVILTVIKHRVEENH